jgi:hypothetical protein
MVTQRDELKLGSNPWVVTSYIVKNILVVLRRVANQGEALDITVEQAVCKLLLGSPEDAERALGLSPDSTVTPDPGVLEFVMVRPTLMDPNWRNVFVAYSARCNTWLGTVIAYGNQNPTLTVRALVRHNRAITSGQAELNVRDSMTLDTATHAHI